MMVNLFQKLSHRLYTALYPIAVNTYAFTVYPIQYY